MSDKVEKLTFVSAQMPVDLADDLKALAERNDRPLSAELRRAVRRHLDAEGNGENEKAS